MEARNIQALNMWVEYRLQRVSCRRLRAAYFRRAVADIRVDDPFRRECTLCAAPLAYTSTPGTNYIIIRAVYRGTLSFIHRLYTLLLLLSF